MAEVDTAGRGVEADESAGDGGSQGSQANLGSAVTGNTGTWSPWKAAARAGAKCLFLEVHQLRPSAE
ncbi:hypothetical protein CCHR01_19453 [Colletotrichum chrysophilum]|uniref:Uncharacterized protein n=1 Tax=Colletotrichum chrysophilum TaxID=1836956 RepID=A0AAD8ZYK2_9PEZI|nr:hypothetical protein CCHR01_19453 [Colletotrichum chrysophilum]